jgi:hypothetical protein
MKFDVRYYLVAILFIIFDLEIAFLFPWAVVARRDRRLRAPVHGDVPRRARGRLHLRVEEGGAGMGLSAACRRQTGLAEGGLRHHAASTT